MIIRKRKIRSVTIHGGQGDAVMSVNGLQALIELDVPFLASDARIYTRTIVEPLAKIMLPDLEVINLSHSKGAPRPRYATSAKTSWTTIFRNWFGKNYYINFAERRRRASFGYPKPGVLKKLQQKLTDIRLSSGTNWRRETPSYYGLKMWAPLADDFGFSEIDMIRGLYSSYNTISKRLKNYLNKFNSFNSIHVKTTGIAIFPSGRSFQYLPPLFLRKLVDELNLKNSDYTCFFSPNDDFIKDYEKVGLNCNKTKSIDEVLHVVGKSDITVTCDSFVSHIAQLVSKKHIALMSHDIPQHTIHPASESVIVYEPLNCCPCHYVNRNDAKAVCHSNYSMCNIFNSKSYLTMAVNSF